MGNLFSCLKKNSVDVAAVAEVRNAPTPKRSYESLAEKMKRQANMFTASSFAEVEPMPIDEEGHGRRPKNPSPPRDAKITKNSTRRKVSKSVLSSSFQILHGHSGPISLKWLLFRGSWQNLTHKL